MRKLFARTMNQLNHMARHPASSAVKGQIARAHVGHLATMSLQDDGPLRSCERREIARAIERRVEFFHLGTMGH